MDRLQGPSRPRRRSSPLVRRLRRLAVLGVAAMRAEMPPPPPLALDEFERREVERPPDPARLPGAFPDSCSRALADLGLYGVAEPADLRMEHFRNNPRGWNEMFASGVIEEVSVRPPGERKPFPAVRLRKSGLQVLESGIAGDTRHPYRIRPPAHEAVYSHDTGVYRAVRAERARMKERGRRLLRERGDPEMRAIVGRNRKLLRDKQGRRRFCDLYHIGLDETGSKLFLPDAQFLVANPGGSLEACNVELTTSSYSPGRVAAAVGNGYSVYAQCPSSGYVVPVGR